MIKNNTLTRQVTPTAKSGRRHGRTSPKSRLQSPLLSIVSVLPQTLQKARTMVWWESKDPLCVGRMKRRHPDAPCMQPFGKTNISCCRKVDRPIILKDKPKTQQQAEAKKRTSRPSRFGTASGTSCGRDMRRQSAAYGHAIARGRDPHDARDGGGKPDDVLSYICSVMGRCKQKRTCNLQILSGA